MKISLSVIGSHRFLRKLRWRCSSGIREWRRASSIQNTPLTKGTCIESLFLWSTISTWFKQIFSNDLKILTLHIEHLSGYWLSIIGSKTRALLFLRNGFVLFIKLLYTLNTHISDLVIFIKIYSWVW